MKVAAAHRADREPAALRGQAARNWESRWLSFLSVATQDALAATLVSDGSRFLDGFACPEVLSVDVWLDGRGSGGAVVSPLESIPLDGLVEVVS